MLIIVILLSIIVGMFIFITRNNKQNKNILSEVVEASTVYNESPVKWIKQYSRLENKLANNIIQTEQSHDTKTIYVLETHQITQRILSQFAIDNKTNMLFFHNLVEMADFFNQELEKPKLSTVVYLPDIILASDLNGAADLMNEFKKNEDAVPELTKAKLIVLSQNPNYGGQVAMTITKPIDIQNTKNILNTVLKNKTLVL